MRESLPKKVVGFIVDALNDNRGETGLRAQSRPAKLSVKEYELLASQGRIVVHFAGSRYGKPDVIGAIVQDRDMFFDCIVIRKSLRSDAGEDDSLDVLEAIEEILTGLMPPDCTTALSPDTDGFLAWDEDKGVLQHQVRMTCKGVMVQPVPLEDRPVLQEISTIKL